MRKTKFSFTVEPIRRSLFVRMVSNYRANLSAPRQLIWRENTRESANYIESWVLEEVYGTLYRGTYHAMPGPRFLVSWAMRSNVIMRVLTARSEEYTDNSNLVKMWRNVRICSVGSFMQLKMRSLLNKAEDSFKTICNFKIPLSGEIQKFVEIYTHFCCRTSYLKTLNLSLIRLQILVDALTDLHLLHQNIPTHTSHYSRLTDMF